MAVSDDGVIVGVDQGTTGSTALVLDHDLVVRGRATHEFSQHYPRPGWVEHDPEELWSTLRRSVIDALDEAGVEGSSVRAVGITNQRETHLFWERATGRPIHRAIVWLCRRTTEMCSELREAGHEPLVRERTGLILDPYFSGTKARWLLDHVDGARERARRGELAFGTVDSWVLWRLTGGSVHATDVSNASRTLLMNIHELDWDDELLELLDVPRAALPEVRSSSEVYGETRGLDFLPDGIPIAGMAGDQQAALFGQACHHPGDVKATYGTGSFVLMNAGTEPPPTEHGLLTTIGWRLGDGPTTYALEGSIFVAGSAVQWLRDQLGLIDAAPQIEELARSVDDTGGVVMVPAFAGLGAPHWDPEARGALLGLTHGSGRAQVARATLESIAQQVADVAEAMIEGSGRDLSKLRVDGGAATNDLLMEMQADLLGTPVTRPAQVETTAIGASALAGIGVGFWRGLDDIAERWKMNRRFESQLPAADRRARREAWFDALRRITSMPR